VTDSNDVEPSTSTPTHGHADAITAVKDRIVQAMRNDRTDELAALRAELKRLRGEAPAATTPETKSP